MLRGETSNAIVSTAVSAGVPIITAAIVPGSIAAGAGAAGSAAISASLAVPLIGAAVAGIALAITMLLNRKGPRQKVETTKIVDQLEPLLKQNVTAYQEGPRTRSSQAAALASFDQAWNWLTSGDACGNPGYGNPGKACIADRQQGGRWDWFHYYRDPIAQDPDVRADPTAVQEAQSAISDAVRLFVPNATPEQLAQGQNFLLLAALAALVIAI